MRYKQALITWLGVYPTLGLTWLILPLLTRVFRG
jgi:antibiotic biosynthesis monooxygenase (ABM) superfamily enzyme